MGLNVAKCNLSKVKLQASVVCVLPLKRMRSVGWPQGPLICDLQCISCCHFELIFADLVLKSIFADSGSKPFPPFLGLCIGKYGVGWVFSTEFLQCDNASWWLHARVIPARRVAMDTSLLFLRCSVSRPTFKAPVPKLIYWRWVQRLLPKIGPPLYSVRSKPHEGLAVCRAKAVPPILSYLKALSIGSAPGIKPATHCTAVKYSTDWANLATYNVALPVAHTMRLFFYHYGLSWNVFVNIRF